MCDYDGGYQHISDRMVTTRKKHECSSCSADYPAGTKMKYVVGKFEGEFDCTYCCQTCQWAFDQVDETPLHLCWGWGYDAQYDDRDKWNYIDGCLKRGETPTLNGWLKYECELLAASEEE